MFLCIYQFLYNAHTGLKNESARCFGGNWYRYAILELRISAVPTLGARLLLEMTRGGMEMRNHATASVGQSA
jgi:hypothetical protein